MIRSDKKLKELNITLNGGSALKIMEAVKSLRNEIPYEGAIGLLIEYYDRNTNLSVNSLIRDFMNDLKDQSVTDEVISEIRKQTNPQTLRMLISSCWQSGLDYSGYLDEFTKQFLSADYMTAIECFSVIEVSVHHLSRARKNEIIKMIRANSMGLTDEKTVLTLELISVLS